MSTTPEKTKGEIIFDLSVKFTGLALMVFMVISQVLITPIEPILWGIPLIMMGLDVSQIIKKLK